MTDSRPVAAIQRYRTTTHAGLGWTAIGGAAYFVFAIALLHTLRPDVDPLARVTSEYAVGPFGFLMSSAYLVFSVALVALALGLALLVVASLGTAVAAFFPVDVARRGRSRRAAGSTESRRSSRSPP